MSRLDNYRSALLAVHEEIPDAELEYALERGGAEFATFIIDHGLGPLWHERTGHSEFHASRLSAEALFLAQQQALHDIDAAFDDAGIAYAVIKGAGNRLLINENPAIRACYDIDLLVLSETKRRTAAVLMKAGFTAIPESRSISRELVFSRGSVDIDLHWGLLREGRLRTDFTAAILDRRRRLIEVWMASPEDAFFLLLVHPAFAKHLSGWTMGLHRVVDIVNWLRTQSFDWPIVLEMLARNGVCAAAWATLRWVELLTRPFAPTVLVEMISDVCPGRLRRNWLNYWLRNDFSARMANKHWVRLLAFSPFLHDTMGDSLRAFAGRLRARSRSESDLALFRKLTS